MKELDDLLYSNIDLEYKKFNDKIINTNMKTLGVRTPILKHIARNYKDKIDINKIDNSIYEKYLIKGFIISLNKDINYVIENLDKYMRLNDNWAICDMVTSNAKIFKKNKDIVYDYVIKNINDSNNFIVRYVYVILLDYFMEEKYLSKIFNIIDNDKNNNYYVYMAKAWLISICYIKYPKVTFEYLKDTKIDNITYNKTIDKIRDSKRVDVKDKSLLKNMKRKIS